MDMNADCVLWWYFDERSRSIKGCIIPIISSREEDVISTANTRHLCELTCNLLRDGRFSSARVIIITWLITPLESGQRRHRPFNHFSGVRRWSGLTCKIDIDHLLVKDGQWNRWRKHDVGVRDYRKVYLCYTILISRTLITVNALSPFLMIVTNYQHILEYRNYFLKAGFQTSR